MSAGTTNVTFTANGIPVGGPVTAPPNNYSAPGTGAFAGRIATDVGTGVAVNRVASTGFGATAARARGWAAKTGSAVWGNPWGKAGLIGAGVVAGVAVVRSFRHRDKAVNEHRAGWGRGQGE